VTILPDISTTGLVLLAVLCAYYLIANILIGANLPQGPILPKYGPPDGMSPAEMRYLLTGTTDRKSVAAVLVHLASHKLIVIQPELGDYRISLMVQEPPQDVPAEEAAALRAIAEVQSFALSDQAASTANGQPASFLLRPARGQHVSLIGSVISGSVNARVEKAYFNRNLRYSLPAFAFSFLVVLVKAVGFEHHGNGVFFLTVWFMFCSLIVGIITAMTVAPALRDALRGRLGATSVLAALVPLLMFSGVMGFVDWKISQGSNPGFAWSLVAVAAINIGFAISLKRLTPLGRQRLDDILGFRQFLASVELDRFDRMNDPRLTPALLNDYLAYAIALDLKEAWGDHFSSALFATATSSG
jgi:Predicted membrane protein (DUF2207) C-terminal domain